MVVPDHLDPLDRARVCFLGVGNPDYGDDGFGVHLANELKSAGVPDVLVAGAEPEKYLGQIAEQGFSDLVFLDAVDFGGKPGSLVVLGGDQILARFPQISTHKISLGTLARVVQANSRARVWLLGVQPESLKQEGSLTATVRQTLDIAKELLQGGGLLEAFNERSELSSELEENAC